MIKHIALALAIVALAACNSPKKTADSATKPSTGGVVSAAKKASGADAMQKTAGAAAKGDVKGAAAGAAASTPQGQMAAKAADAAKKQ